MNKYFFVHVPKTGGTSILKYLQNYIHLWHEDGKPNDQCKNYDMIFGHIDPSYYVNRKRIIWLRHPVERVISNYLHLIWRFQNTNKKFIIIDDKVRRFSENIDIVNFTKHTTHVYKFFTKYDPTLFNFIGFNENMNSQLKKLCEFLQLPHNPDLLGNHRSNQKPHNVNITNSQRKEIRKILSYDIEFYNYLKTRYDKE